MPPQDTSQGWPTLAINSNMSSPSLSIAYLTSCGIYSACGVSAEFQQVVAAAAQLQFLPSVQIHVARRLLHCPLCHTQVDLKSNAITHFEESHEIYQSILPARGGPFKELLMAQLPPVQHKITP